jgi:hypothetical protein
LLFASAHTGKGDVLMPEIAHNVMVCRAAPLPTSRSASLTARALPPGNRFIVLSGRASRVSSSHAFVSIGPACET